MWGVDKHLTIHKTVFPSTLHFTSSGTNNYTVQNVDSSFNCGREKYCLLKPMLWKMSRLCSHLCMIYFGGKTNALTVGNELIITATSDGLVKRLGF